MQITRLRALGLLAAAMFIAGLAHGDVDLRVEAWPRTEPVDVFVRVSANGDSITGLTAKDFTVTLDGAPLDQFTLTLPPSQDSTQRLSIVIVMRDDRFAPSESYSALIEQLEIGDLVSIVKYWGDIESPRYGGILLLPFTEIDGGPGSDQLNEFIAATPPFDPSGFRYTLFDGLLAGLTEFATASATLPEGPKAIVTVGCCGGLPSLSEVIAAANAGSIPIFNAGYSEWDAYPDVVASSRALAENTGGIHARVEVGSSVREAIETMTAWLKDGYRLEISPTAVVDCDPHMLEVTVGGESTNIPFARCDTTPEPFELVDLSDAPVATQATSEAVTITGIETAVPITVFDGEYSVGCGSTFTNEMGWMLPGESVCVRHRTAASGGLEVSTLLIVGAVSDWFVSSTLFSPPPPTDSPPPPQGANGGGGGFAGVAELLMLLGLLLAAGRRGDVRSRAS